MTENLEQLESTQDSAPTSPEATNESASETVRETLNRVLANQEIPQEETAETPQETEEVKEEATEEIQYLASEAERMLGLIEVSEHDDIRSQVAEEMKKLNFNKNPNIYKYLFGETYTTIQ